MHHTHAKSWRPSWKRLAQTPQENESRHLIFYRFDRSTLYAERVIHGMRDLPRRLLQPPDATA